MAGLESILRTLATGQAADPVTAENDLRQQGIDALIAQKSQAARDTELSSLRSSSAGFKGGINQAVEGNNTGALIQGIMEANYNQDPAQAEYLKARLAEQQVTDQAAGEYAPAGAIDALKHGKVADYLANLAGQTTVNLAPQVAAAYLARPLGRAGSIVAGAGTGYDMNRNEAATDLFADPVAWEAAQRDPARAKAILDATALASTATDVVPGMIGGRAAKQSAKAIVTGAKPAAKDILLGAAGEGLQEAVQHGISDAGRATLTDRSLADVADPAAYLENAIGGALMGGGVSTAAHGVNTGLAKVGQANTAVEDKYREAKAGAEARFEQAKKYTGEKVQQASALYDDVQAKSGKEGPPVPVSVRAANATKTAGDFLRRHYDSNLAQADRIWNEIKINPETGRPDNDAGVTASLVNAAANIGRMSKDQAAAYTQKLLGEDYGHQNMLDTLHRAANAKEWADLAPADRQARQNAVLQAGTEFISNLPDSAISKKARRELLSNPKDLEKASKLYDRAKAVHTWARENGDVEAGAFAEAFITGRVKMNAATTGRMKSYAEKAAAQVVAEKTVDMFDNAHTAIKEASAAVEGGLVDAALKPYADKANAKQKRGGKKANMQATAISPAHAGVAKMLNSFVRPELKADPVKFAEIQTALEKNAGAIASRIADPNDSLLGKLGDVFDPASFPKMKQTITAMVDKLTRNAQVAEKKGRMSDTVPEPKSKVAIKPENVEHTDEESSVSERQATPPVKEPAAHNRNVAYAVHPAGKKDKVTKAAAARKGVTVQTGKEFFDDMRAKGDSPGVFLSRIKTRLEDSLLQRAGENTAIANVALRRLKGDSAPGLDDRLKVFREYAQKNDIKSGMAFLKDVVDPATKIESPKKMWTDTTTKDITENAGSFLPSEIAAELQSAYTRSAAQRSFGGSVAPELAARVKALRLAMGAFDERTQGRIELAVADNISSIMEKDKAKSAEKKAITEQSQKELTSRYSSVSKALAGLRTGETDWEKHFDVSVAEIADEDKGYAATDSDLDAYSKLKDNAGAGTKLSVYFEGAKQPVVINTRSMVSATRIDSNNNPSGLAPTPERRFSEALAKIMARSDVTKITVSPTYGEDFYGAMEKYGTQAEKAKATEALAAIKGKAGKPIVLADTTDGKLAFAGDIPEDAWIMPPKGSTEAVTFKGVTPKAPTPGKPTDETRKEAVAKRDAKAARNSAIDADEKKAFAAVTDAAKNSNESSMGVAMRFLKNALNSRYALEKELRESDALTPEERARKMAVLDKYKIRTSALNRVVTDALRKEYPTADIEGDSALDDMKTNRFALEKRIEELTSAKLTGSQSYKMAQDDLDSLTNDIEALEFGGDEAARKKSVAITGSNPQVEAGAREAEVRQGAQRVKDTDTTREKIGARSVKAEPTKATKPAFKNNDEKRAALLAGRQSYTRMRNDANKSRKPADADKVAAWQMDKAKSDTAITEYARNRAEAPFRAELAALEAERRAAVDTTAVMKKIAAVTERMNAAGTAAAQSALKDRDTRAIQNEANDKLRATFEQATQLRQSQQDFQAALREERANTPKVRSIQKKYADRAAKLDAALAKAKSPKAQARFDAAMLDLTRAMNEELSGVGKAPTGKKPNVQQARKKTAAQTAQDKLRDSLKAELLRTSGEKVQLIFKRLAASMGMTGSFEALEDGGKLVEIAIDAADPQGVLRHETFHHFWDGIGTTKEVRKLKLAMQKFALKPEVRNLVLNMLVDEDIKQGANEAESLAKFSAELADPEEALAYTYQMYLQFPDEMREVFAPKGFAVLEAIKKFAMDTFGLITQAEKTRNIFDALNRGDFARDETRAHLALNAYGATLTDKLNSMGELAHAYQKVMNTALERVRDMNVPALTELADLVSKEVGDEIGGRDLISSREQLAGKLKFRASAIIETYETDAQQLVSLDNLQARRDPSTPQEKKIRALLDNVMQMMKTAGVDIGEVKENYFPRVWDAQTIANNREAFITLLKDEGKIGNTEAAHIADSMQIYGGISDVAENENDVGYTPPVDFVQSEGFSSSNARVFDFITRENAPKFAQFQQKDMGYVLDTYLTEAAHKIAYAQTFGADGKVSRDLIERARKEGATEDEIKFTVDAVRGVVGTLKQTSLSMKTKNILGWSMFALNTAMLPLALISQMIDPFAVAARSGELQDAFDAYKRGFSTIFKDLTRDKTKDYHHQMADFLGVLHQDLSSQAMGSMASKQSAMLRRWSNAYFKGIGMQAFNDGMRVAAVAAADRYILRKAAEGDDTALAELGLSRSDVKATDEGRLEIIGNPRVEGAVYRYVQSAVVSSNNAYQPHWMNDPNMLLLAHMRRFSYAFDKVVMQRAAKQMSEYGNSAPTMILLASMPIILAADMAKWAVLGGPVRADWGIGGYISHAFNRAGFSGRHGAYWQFMPGGEMFDFKIDKGPAWGLLEAVSSMDMDKILDKTLLGHKFI